MNEMKSLTRKDREFIEGEKKHRGFYMFKERKVLSALVLFENFLDKLIESVKEEDTILGAHLCGVKGKLRQCFQIEEEKDE